MGESESDYRENFRTNLKSFRLKKGLTQTELSTRANYDATYVGKLERAESAPSMDTVVRIGRAMHINPLKLLRPPEAHLDVREELSGQELKELPFNPLDIQIFDSLPFTMGLLSDSGTLVYVNDAFVDLTGIDRDEIQEQKLWELPLWNFRGRSSEELIDVISDIHAIQGHAHYRMLLEGDEEDSIDFLLYPTPREHTETEDLMLIFELRKIDRDTIKFPLHIQDYHQQNEDQSD